MNNDFVVSKKITYISFNQDYSLFVIGTNKGFEVYSTNPFKLISERSK